MQKTIFFTISRGSLIRNFFHTGVIKRLLNTGIRVVVLTPNYKDKEIFRDFEHENLILEPLMRSRKIKFGRLINEFFKGSVFNRTVFLAYIFKFTGEKPSKILLIPRIIFFAPLRLVPGFRKFIRWAAFRMNPQNEHDYLFEKYKPDLVFATTAHSEPDVGVLKSAKRFGVTTVQMPKSGDNPTRILFSMKTDYMIVWSAFMKKQILKLQDYEDEEVHVTGAPQFDYYAHRENLLTREEFCRQFNFNPNRKFVLYISAARRSPNDADYISLIKEFVDDGELQEVQVLARPHAGYVDDDKKFVSIEKYKGFAVDRTGKQSEKFKDHWDISMNHLHNLLNSFYHADVCVNIASTTCLDAVLCDTESINIDFDVREGVPLSESPRRFYYTDYDDAVNNFGATWHVKSKEEFKQALKAILENDKRKNDKKEDFIKYFAHKNDGKSAERIANGLINIMNKNENS